MNTLWKKRVTACGVCLCLLIGCLPIGLVAAGQTVTATAITAVPSEENLLQGLVPIANDATDHAKHIAYGNTKPANISDGKYPGLNQFVSPVREGGQLVNVNDDHPEYGIKNNVNDTIVQFSCWTNDYIDLTFDLGNDNKITSFIIGNTAEPGAVLKSQAESLTDQEIIDLYKANAQASMRLFKGEFFVADRPSKLFAADTCAAQWDYSNATMPQVAGFDLPTAKIGRYVGFRLYIGSGWASLFRIGELAVFGSYVDPEGMPDMTNNLLAADGAVLTEYFALKARGIHNATAVDENGNPGTQNLGEIPVLERETFWREGDTTLLTDGSPDTLCSMNSYAGPGVKDGTILNYNNPWSVYIYYLGGYARIDSLSLVSTPEMDLNIAGVQYYASERYSDLFKNESLLYTSGGEYYTGNETDGYLPDVQYDLTKRVATYDLTEEQRAATYRYVAFVVTRPFPMYIQGKDKRVVGYNISRIGELHVDGVIETPEEPMKTTYDVETDFGKVTVNIAPLNFDDQAFFSGIGDVTVTEESLDASVQRHIENNWLTVAYDKAFHVQVFDKQGNPIEQGNTPRSVEVLFPVDSKETYASGLLENGQIRRLYNGNTRTDGTLKAGENNYPIYADTVTNNREKAVIQTLDFSVVLLKYNDKDTIYRLNGAVENKPIVEFFGTNVAGAAETTCKGWHGLWYLPLLGLLLTVMGILIHKRCGKRG